MIIEPRLARQAWAARGALTSAILLGALGGVLIILQARLLARLINQVFLDGQGREGVTPLFVGLVVIVGLRFLVLLFGEAAATGVSVQVKERLRGLYIRHLAELGPVFTQCQHIGELVNTATQGIEAIDAYFSQYLPQLALAGLLPISILIVVFPTDTLSAVILLVTAPLIPIFMILIGKASEAVTRKQYTALSRLSAYFLDTLQGLRELKLLGQSQSRAQKIKENAEQYRSATLRVLRVTFLSAFTLELVGTISTAVIAVAIGLRLLYGRLGFEEAFFILLLAPEFYQPLRQLGQRFHAAMNGLAAAKRIFGVLDHPLPPPGTTKEKEGCFEFPAGFNLEFQRVSFTHPERGQPALEDITFSLQQGHSLALVGESGTGKTTLAYLLLRFLRPSQGLITLNGRLIDEIQLESWRSQIGWVPQRPFLFNTSLGENISLGRPGATQSEILEAARLAQLSDFITHLPAGLDSPVGEMGFRLSAGQAQRVALARVFLIRPAIVLFDEPTAHLDPEAEALFEEAFRILGRTRTVITIAHRLSTVEKADKILVLSSGRLAGCGTHHELLLTNSIYAGLIQAQGGRE